MGGISRDEDAIAIVRIEDGVESCTVGFIARVQMHAPKDVWSVNMFCVVAEFHNILDIRYIRGIAQRNYGMAGLNLVDNIPLIEQERKTIRAYLFKLSTYISQFYSNGSSSEL
jgi:hypothetical protein